MGLMRLNKYGFVGISHVETNGVGTQRCNCSEMLGNTTQSKPKHPPPPLSKIVHVPSLHSWFVAPN
jgi:hypothetical protein